MLKHFGSLPAMVEVTLTVAGGVVAITVVVAVDWVIPRQEQADE